MFSFYPERSDWGLSEFASQAQSALSSDEEQVHEIDTKIMRYYNKYNTKGPLVHFERFEWIL